MNQVNWSALYSHGKKILIWGIFFLVLYVLRDLFGLVFFTFLLAFITYRVSDLAVEHLNVSRRFALSLIYLLLVAALVWMGYLVVPRVFGEAREFASELPQVESKVSESIESFRGRYPELTPILNAYAGPEKIDAALSKLTGRAVQTLPRLIQGFLNGLMTVLLSILFSFLIVIDLARLSRDLKRLRTTRLHDFFEETAKPIVTFARVVGRAFEAQTLIAVVNTLLTVFGMLVLDIPRVALLGIIVFVCSFVPVLGVLVSSVPIALVAFNASGFWLAFAALVMILAVHGIEAYVINPRIYAYHMKMNPVLVLIVLFLGHHLFGVWGVLLAVPVTNYFITHVAGLQPSRPRRAGLPFGARKQRDTPEAQKPATESEGPDFRERRNEP